MGKMPFLRDQKGQILLIVVLAMVVALTIGLAVASKSIIGLRTSTEQAESQKALSAAEAGIEQLLKTSLNTTLSGDLANNTSFSTVATQISGLEFLLSGGVLILRNDGTDIWLSDYSSDLSLIYLNQWTGILTLRWGDNSGACNNAALEVVVISGTKANPVLTKYAVDPCQDRANTNNLTYVSGNQGTISGRTFYYASSITITNGLIARVVPLYENTSIGVSGTVALPNQGSVISSSGKSGETERKVTVFRGYPKVPSELFPYNLFTP
ncbi:MAG: hypothetical protein V1697_03285 [Candidatus Levyibacteriota bacterium]